MAQKKQSGEKMSTLVSFSLKFKLSFGFYSSMCLATSQTSRISFLIPVATDQPHRLSYIEKKPNQNKTSFQLMIKKEGFDEHATVLLIKFLLSLHLFTILSCHPSLSSLKFDCKQFSAGIMSFSSVWTLRCLLCRVIK